MSKENAAVVSSWVDDNKEKLKKLFPVLDMVSAFQSLGVRAYIFTSQITLFKYYVLETAIVTQPLS